MCSLAYSYNYAVAMFSNQDVKKLAIVLCFRNTFTVTTKHIHFMRLHYVRTVAILPYMMAYSIILNYYDTI